MMVWTFKSLPTCSTTDLHGFIDTSTSVRVIFYGLSVFLSCNIVERIFLSVLVPSLRNFCFHTHILPLRIRTDLPWVLLIAVMIVLMMLLLTLKLLPWHSSSSNIHLFISSSVPPIIWNPPWHAWCGERWMFVRKISRKKDRAGMTWSSRQLARQENIEVR
jgi:hypothetical protein